MLFRSNMLDMNLQPGKKKLELQSLHIEHLEKDYRALRTDDFIEKWVRFDFRGEAIKMVCWELIHDYFHIHQNGRIIDQRDFSEKIEDSYSGLSSLYPQGNVVRLSFKISQWKPSIWTKFFGSSVKLTKELDLSSVKRIKGTLTSLFIQTEHETIFASDEIAFLRNAM